MSTAWEQFMEHEIRRHEQHLNNMMNNVVFETVHRDGKKQHERLVPVLLKDITCTIDGDGVKHYQYEGKRVMSVKPDIAIRLITDGDNIHITATQEICTHD